MNCTEGGEFRQNVGLHVVMAFQISLSLLSIVANFLLIWLSKRYVFFHDNFKILVLASLITNIIHALANAGNQGYHLYKLFMATKDCDVMVSQLTCLLFRYPPIFCITSFVIIHACMLVERIIAARKRDKYHYMGTKMAIFLLFMITVTCLLSAAVRMQRFPRYSYTAVCLAMTKDTYSTLITGCMLLACVEIIFLATYVSLRCMNKRLLNNTVYTLNERFYLKENILVLKLLGPLFVLTFIMLLLFAIFNLIIFGVIEPQAPYSTVSLLHGFAYIIPYYTFACPLLIWIILKRYEKETRRAISRQLHISKHNERMMYFDTYNKMWRRFV